MNRPARLAFAAAFALLASPGAASAEPTFPGIIQQDIAPGCPLQPCTLCHGSAAGSGPPVTAFGKYLVSQGLLPDVNGASLTAALAKDQAAMHVSNAAGITDVDALRMCLAPDGATAGASPPPVEVYGCGATSSVAGARRPAGSPAALALALGTALVMLRARRR
jgi:hypothetical protein